MTTKYWLGDRSPLYWCPVSMCWKCRERERERETEGERGNKMCLWWDMLPLSLTPMSAAWAVSVNQNTEWTDSSPLQQTRQNKKRSPSQGSCGETWPAGVIVGSYTEAWMNLRLDFISVHHLRSQADDSYPQSFGRLSFPFRRFCFLFFSLCDHHMVVVLFSFSCNIFSLSYSAQFNFVCLIDNFYSESFWFAF